MSNLKSAPVWLTQDVVDRVQRGVDRAAAVRVLVQLELSDAEIALIERIAMAAGMSPSMVARGMIRAGMPVVA